MKGPDFHATCDNIKDMIIALIKKCTTTSAVLSPLA